MNRNPSERRSTTKTARFRFRLLGRFAAWRNDVPLSDIEIGSRKGRTLLKLLLVDRGHVVGIDRIAEVLWGEPPENADRLIASLISRLRGVVGADALEGGPGGYRFTPAARLEVDLDEAERLVGEAEARLSAGEPSLGSTAAQRALELLRGGPVLEDEPYADWAEPARTAGTRLLRRARRATWLAAGELGDAEGALDAAEAATEADPLDEEAHRAVMLAHQRAARPGQALAAYERLKAILADELGADPSPESNALHLAILREEPPPDVDASAPGTRATGPAATPPPTPSDPDFVGRDEELSLLSGLWRDAARGHSNLVLVAGEAGIGKTRLATEIGHLAESTGGAVAQARCYEAERSLFLQPLTDAIRSIVVATEPDVIREVVGPWSGTLSELVPEVGLILRPHRYERTTPEIERRRSFEAVTAFFRSIAERHPLLLFLDDLHQAGSSTLELLHYLGRRATRSRLLVLATVRIEEGEEAIARLADVARRLDVGPLSERAVNDLATRMGGAAVVDRVTARARGHPLFVLEILRALAERQTEEQELAIPPTLRTAVLERVKRTGPETEEILRAGAVLGSAFDLGVAARMLEISVEEAGRRAERGRRARLIVEAGPAYEFANDLIREILYRTTPQPILAARHARAAELLAGNPEAVASHAAAAGDWARALEASLVAADRAAARYANRDAELLLDRALDAALRLEDRAGEGRARLARGRVREALGRYTQAHEDHTAALALAREAGDRTTEVLALRELGGDVLVATGRSAKDGLPHLEAALPIATALGDVASQVNVLSRTAVIWTNRLCFDLARERASRAVELARPAGDEYSLALALDGMKTVAAYMGDLPTLEDVMPELERLLRQTGNLRWLQWALFESSFPAMARAQWDRALARIEEAVALSGRIGYRADAAMFVAHRSWIERSRGRYGASRATARQAVELAEEAGHPWWEGFARAMLGWTLAEMGAVDEAGEQLERGLDAAQREGSENYVARSLAHLALVAQSRGDRKSAGQLLDRTEAILGAVTVPPGGAFLHGAHAYLAAARTALARDEPDRAERLTLPIIDAARAAGWKEAAAEAAMVRGRARLALADPTGAEQFLRRSLEEIEGSELPRVAWEAHAVLADVLAATRGTEEARDHRVSARAAVRSLADSIDDEADRKSFLAATRRLLRSARR